MIILQSQQNGKINLISDLELKKLTTSYQILLTLFSALRQ